jgi:hypothetical protein
MPDSDGPLANRMASQEDQAMIRQDRTHELRPGGHKVSGESWRRPWASSIRLAPDRPSTIKENRND